MNAEIESKPAERIVDVRGVAGEKYPALAKRRRHALVHIVEIAVYDLVAAWLGNEFLQTALDRLVGEQFGLSLLQPGRRQHPPQALAVVTRHLEQCAPI